MKKIFDFPGYYVSEDGRVWSNKGRGRWLLPQLSKKGYLRVCLRCSGKSYWFFVHRLVAGRFVPNPQNHPQVNHMDGNKVNNHYTNLEWVTAQQNTDHAVVTGLRDHLNEPVDCFSAKTGKFLRTFPSMNAAERASRGKYSADGISLAVVGKAITAGGYQWRLAVQFDQLPPLTAAQINKAVYTSANYHVRNKTTGEEFTSHAEVEAAGYNASCVANVVAGRTRTHAGCEWERVSNARKKL